MINTAIVMSPIETAPDRGATAGAQKNQPDSSGFGAVLDSKIEAEQGQSQEAKPVEGQKPGNDPEPQLKTQPEGKSEGKPKTATENKPEAASESKPETAKPDAGDAKLDGAAVVLQAVQAAINQAANPAKGAEAVSDKGQSAETVEVEAAPAVVVKPMAQVQTPAPAITPVNADQQTQPEAGKQDVVPEPAEQTEKAAQPDSRTVDVGLTRVGGNEAEPKTGEAGTETRAAGTGTGKQTEAPNEAPKDTAFLDLAAKGMVQEAQVKASNNQPDTSTDALKQTQTQDRPAGTDTAEPTKAQLSVKADVRAAAAATVTAQAKPVEAQPTDVTLKPHVVAALMDEMKSQVIKVDVSGGSGKPGGDSAGSSRSQTAAQDAVFVIPGRTSFESVIRSLDATAPAQSTDTPNTETRIRIIDQVVQEIRLRQFQGQTDITIKLNPAELGALRLHISQTANGLTSLIHASSDNVKGLLQANLPALTQALSDAGVKMDQVTVTSPTSYDSLMHDNASGTAYQQDGKSGRHNTGGSSEMDVKGALINAAMGGVTPGGSARYSWLA